ncbi:hypothetical protein FOA43_000070 [Brettanomyces nanus]|uniref:Protein kinase domain-containing protein n=1 Tax=Eeniella nana TaxID=13502 RepID=A0A875RYL5_EENNA|nr:uncharacterized protein FOA43_000070 [Brettanomyces nanus]QPG72769.1 hypothetical protein FOA43_000070 [Brettanomyces nanus]
MESHMLYTHGYSVDQQQPSRLPPQPEQVRSESQSQAQLQSQAQQQRSVSNGYSEYPDYAYSSNVYYQRTPAYNMQQGQFSGFSFEAQSDALTGGASASSSSPSSASRVGLSNRTLSSFSHNQQRIVPASIQAGQMGPGLSSDYLIPLLRNSYSDPSQQQISSSSSVFRDPWVSSFTSNSRTTTNEYQPNLSNVRRTPRKSFTSTLSTTFEDMELTSGLKRQKTPSLQPLQPLQPLQVAYQQEIVPPSRIDPPPPSTLTAQAHAPPRRQSVAAGYLVPNHERDEGTSSTSSSPVTRFQHGYPQGYYQVQPSVKTLSLKPLAPIVPKRVLPAPKFRKLTSREDLSPHINAKPKYRRAASSNTFLSPLNALTSSLTVTYSMCVPEFDYKTSKNPRRVLTKPSNAVTNNGYDNEQSDYILYVNDVLGVQENRKYMVVDIIGRGTFGQVVKCQNLDTQEIVAVKVVKSRPVYLNQSLTEAGILEYLNRKVDPGDEHHLLRMKDKFMHKNHFCLVFELLSSNLYELIGQNQFHGLAIKLIKKFTVQLLDALCVLKDAELIHCDLKPENILLVSLDRPEIKVIDFGSACHEKQVAYTYIQSRFYRSPEVILGLSYGSAVDMWSLGCIITELFLGLPLFPGTSEFNQLEIIVRMLGMPPTWMIEMGKNSINLINKRVDPQTGKKYYALKSVEQYSRESHTKQKPGEEYFKDRYLDDIIMHCRLPRKNMTKPMIDLEMENRKCLLHFIKGLLNLNPLERWTPQEAFAHPFVTNQKFTGDWNPPSRKI